MEIDQVLPPMPGGDVPAYYIASVGRALTLVGLFTEHEELSVSEVANLLSISPSSAHRLLQMLVFHGFVMQGDHRRYVRGPQFELVAISAGVSFIRPEDAATPHLRRIRDRLSAAIHLVSLEGNSARFVVGAQTPTFQAALSRIGWLLPAHTVAGGKALLAELSGPALDKLFGDGIPLTRNARIQSLPQLHRELRAVRQSGFARSVRESHEAIAAIAVPVPHTSDGPNWSISAAWPSMEYGKVDIDRAVGELRDAAEEIAYSLQPRLAA